MEKVETISELRLNITEEEVLRLQGYRRNFTHPVAEVKKILEDAIETGHKLAQPQAICTWLRVQEINKDALLLEEDLRLNIGSRVKLWKASEYLAIALCTIGPALENRVSELFVQGEVALALMLDSVGSVAVESLADHINHFICDRANNLGDRTGPRLSPGYGKWGLEDQKVLFNILNGARIGIELNESCTMIPRKSISFCAGIGKTLDNSRINPCRYCGLHTCQYRRHVSSVQRRK